MAVVRNEDVLDTTEAAESTHLSPDAVAAQEALLQAIRMVGCAYNDTSRNLLKKQKFHGGKYLAASIIIVLRDPRIM